jgi:hypothetical protein
MIFPRTVLAGLVVLILLSLEIHARADQSRLEPLEAKSAFAEVSSTQGVVLVDLYADW